MKVLAAPPLIPGITTLIYSCACYIWWQLSPLIRRSQPTYRAQVRTAWDSLGRLYIEKYSYRYRNYKGSWTFLRIMLDKITYDKERERGAHERKAPEKSLDALLVLRGPAFWVPIRGALGRLGQARAPRRTSRITLMTTDHGPTLLSPVSMSWKKENRFAITQL